LTHSIVSVTSKSTVGIDYATGSRLSFSVTKSQISEIIARKVADLVAFTTYSKNCISDTVISIVIYQSVGPCDMGA